MSGQSISIVSPHKLQVGRATSADYCIADDQWMSSHHFELRCGKNQWTILDLQSSNGTQVNGEKISSQVLTDGDVIVAGQTTFLVKFAPNDVMERDQGEVAPLQKHSHEPAAGVASHSASRQASEPVSVGDNPVRSITLEVLGGRDAGRRFWLRPGGEATVGRAAEATHGFAEDAKMSAVHFRVSCTPDACTLTDLKGSNQTYLNDLPVQQAKLYDGDVITAGETTFQVIIVGGSGPPQHRLHATTMVTGPTDDTSLPSSAGIAPTYLAFDCHSGLKLFLGASSEFDASSILAQLAEVETMVLFASADAPHEVTELASGDWQRLPQISVSKKEDQPQQVPRALPGADVDSLAAILVSQWGHNTTFCVCTEESSEEAVQGMGEFWRQIQEIPSLAFLRGFQASEVAEFLANWNPDEVAKWQQIATATFVEVNQGERWAVFAPPQWENQLRRVGFAPAAPWQH